PDADFRDNRAVSYFVGGNYWIFGWSSPIRTNPPTDPMIFLTGDRNIYDTLRADPAKYPFGCSPANAPISLGHAFAPNATAPGWTARIHRRLGNVALRDGSVHRFTSFKLRQALGQTGDPVNLILFP
ncbi:MAG: hypothetical protein RMK20_07020, partial [Verrucomicrobiales bacterium]|nr:hypothetical protein [Verrucomicrobiales bacterium]